MTPADLIGPTLPAGARETRAVAATALFGAFSRAGTSGSLGNELDSQLLLALRDWSDCVLVGAGTVRAEDYGPATLPFAVVSRSLSLDPDSRFFRGTPPLILTPRASLGDASLTPCRKRLTQAGATLIDTGTGSPAEIIAALHARGFSRISCEGGPSLYAAMLAADLIDVMHLTVDPSVSGGDAHHLPLENSDCGTRRFTLEATHVSPDSVLFCRYRRSRA
ncbi:dihydrofolate reductase family protein [Corynebacterium sanguinis]|uniref:dihydrofolate reductase family protein n=1 Tax=Corynebacterium TaxID=1716 RepID=UPI00119CDAF5|nr:MULTISPECIES: dihydrofolate reductase family protein [Corynebacterium]MCT1554390.1 dihydrofolate reductase family protein [Corynebacterium sanguinis]MCT1584078.1 dihydrofolate reductase family protein [Corynebacterium sanguinis]MCT2023683.1 dihydrofolate reductase family protein [Corynebacterium sanguinis]MCT2046572.1 dihydrofolate reductase family protein [Corynebacterium sanguinis]MCT2153367.1 dihydrofolate reductase family protein [Corynebacterium sanguinis]